MQKRSAQKTARFPSLSLTHTLCINNYVSLRRLYGSTCAHTCHVLRAVDNLNRDRVCKVYVSCRCTPVDDERLCGGFYAKYSISSNAINIKCHHKYAFTCKCFSQILSARARVAAIQMRCSKSAYYLLLHHTCTHTHTQSPIRASGSVMM